MMVIDAVLVAIASSLADRSAASLYEFVKSAFHGHPAASVTLAEAAGASPDSSEVQALAKELHNLEAVDPGFRNGLRSRWAALASTEGAATDGGVVNQISGHVNKAVQARDVRGDISFS
jgi:hypothetical protein